MPAVTSGKVLVTGANGYVAAWVLKDLLDNGFSVRGTVRSENKATHLREYFKSFGDKLEFVIVDDITQVRNPLWHPTQERIHIVGANRTTPLRANLATPCLWRDCVASYVR